tara:strand:+ start:38 stop:295 length:258 start_codon:yes stop_codon:yes gene_type:complete
LTEKGKKKAVKKRAPYISKGERCSVARAICKTLRRERTTLDRVLAQYDAHKKGRKTLLDRADTKLTNRYSMKPNEKNIDAAQMSG